MCSCGIRSERLWPGVIRKLEKIASFKEIQHLDTFRNILITVRVLELLFQSV